MKKFLLVFAAVVFIAGLANAAKPAEESITVKMEILDTKNGNKPAGEVVVTESEYGLVFTPKMENIVPGLHGFHIHANADCGPNKEGAAGMAAGGHWDPTNAKAHSFPWDNKGHKGDLPALYANKDGKTPNSVLAPKLKKLSEIKNHALMVHFGGDNHSDNPAPLGGGGPRLACGVIK